MHTTPQHPKAPQRCPHHKKTKTAFQLRGQTLHDRMGDLGWKLQDSPRILAAWHEMTQARMQPQIHKLTLRAE